MLENSLSNPKKTRAGKVDFFFFLLTHSAFFFFFLSTRPELSVAEPNKIFALHYMPPLLLTTNFRIVRHVAVPEIAGGWERGLITSLLGAAADSISSAPF